MSWLAADVRDALAMHDDRPRYEVSQDQLRQQVHYHTPGSLSIPFIPYLATC